MSSADGCAILADREGDDAMTETGLWIFIWSVIGVAVIAAVIAVIAAVSGAAAAIVDEEESEEE